MVLVVLGAGNIVYLNYKVLSKGEPISTASSAQVNESLPRIRFDANSPVNTDLLPVYEAIREATASLTMRLDAFAPSSKPVTATSVKPVVREYYIPLGSGSSSATDWTELAGVEAYVAPSNYGKVKEMYFEAGLRLTKGTGRAYTRLRKVNHQSRAYYSGGVF